MKLSEPFTLVAVAIATVAVLGATASPKPIEERVRHLEQKAGGLQTVISQLFKADKQNSDRVEALEKRVDNLQTVIAISIAHIQILEEYVDQMERKKKAAAMPGLHQAVNVLAVPGLPKVAKEGHDHRYRISGY